MALTKTLTSPITQTALDKARLVLVMADPINKTMSVQLGIGFEVAGVFTPKSVANYVVSGADYDALMDLKGDSEKGIGTSLEEAIWAKLVAMGVVAVS